MLVTARSDIVKAGLEYSIWAKHAMKIAHLELSSKKPARSFSDALRFSTVEACTTLMAGSSQGQHEPIDPATLADNSECSRETAEDLLSQLRAMLYSGDSKVFSRVDSPGSYAIALFTCCCPPNPNHNLQQDARVILENIDNLVIVHTWRANIHQVDFVRDRIKQFSLGH